MRQGINIYIPLETLRELDRLAQGKGKSRGAVVQELVMGAREESDVSTQDVADCMEKAMAKLPVRMGPSDERAIRAERATCSERARFSERTIVFERAILPERTNCTERAMTEERTIEVERAMWLEGTKIRE